MSKLEIQKLQDECLNWRNQNFKLEEIRQFILDKYNEERTIMQIGRWIRTASARRVQDDNLMDINFKHVKGMNELDALQRRIEQMLDAKVVTYEYEKLVKGKKVKKVSYKEISPMALAGLANSLLLVLDKKNQIRGLNNNQIQMLVQQTHNTYSNQITIGEEFKHLDTDVQERLRNIFQESEELADPSRAITIDGEGRIIDEDNGVCEERQE